MSLTSVPRVGAFVVGACQAVAIWVRAASGAQGPFWVVDGLNNDCANGAEGESKGEGLLEDLLGPQGSRMLTQIPVGAAVGEKGVGKS
jgi:hypothetical protein